MIEIHPEVGQVWQEMDKRVTRFVKIVDVSCKVLIAGVRIKVCDADGREIPGKRETRAKLERFNGKSGGYRLVKAA